MDQPIRDSQSAMPDQAAVPAGAPDASTRSPALGGRPIGAAVRLLHILLAVSIWVPVCASGFAAWFDWREIREEAMQNSTRTVQILREHALKVFESHEFAIDQIEERITGLDWPAIRSSQELQQYLARLA